MFSALCMWQITTIPRNVQFCKVRIYMLCVCVVLPLFIHSLINSYQLGFEHAIMGDTKPAHTWFQLSHDLSENKLISKNQDCFTVSIHIFEVQTSVRYITMKVMHLWPYTEKMKLIL